MDVGDLEDSAVATVVQKHWGKLRLVGKVHLMLRLDRQGGRTESLLPPAPVVGGSLQRREAAKSLQLG